jgi:hypothetical protein
VTAPAARSSPAPGGAALRALVASLSRWDLAALVGGGIGAGLWFGWSAMDVKDFVTPIYIALLPVAFVALRRPIDRLLLPLDALKRRVPRPLLVGAGLAAPYLVAHLFYANGVNNFPLARKSIVWGTVVSYVILRIPDPRVRARGAVARAPGGLSCWVVAALAASFALVGTALADDFLRDPTRLEDGLRTGGWAQTIAGSAATVISALVNGALVFQRVTPPPVTAAVAATRGDDGPAEEPARYTMDVRTEGERTSIRADGDDRLWVYAKLTCSKPAVSSASLTNGIALSFAGEHARWMRGEQTQLTGGFKAFQLAARPPSPDAELPDDAAVTVTVSGSTAEGEPIDVPVELELEGELRLKVTILS